MPPGLLKRSHLWMALGVWGLVNHPGVAGFAQVPALERARLATDPFAELQSHKNQKLFPDSCHRKHRFSSSVEELYPQAFPVHRQSDARPCHPWKAYPIVTLRSGTQLVSDECAVFLVWADFCLDPLGKQKHAGSISGGSRSGTAKGNCHPKSYTVQGHSLGRHCEAESGWFVTTLPVTGGICLRTPPK